MLKNHSDSILSIMKTINPIHDAFSKQNKNYNKYFLSLNLNVMNFLRNLDIINKTKSNSHRNDFKYKKNYKYLVDNEIKKTFNKLEKVNYGKYLPRSILNKMKAINENVEEENLEKERRLEIIEKRIKKLKMISKLDEKYYKGITLDPGRYDPKYNLVYKRTKDVFIGRPKTSYRNNNPINNDTNYENTKENKILQNLKTKSFKGINHLKNKTTYKKIDINNKKINKLSWQYNFKTNRLSSKSSRNKFSINIQSRTLSPKINAIFSLKKNRNRKNINEFRNKKIFSAKNKNINLNLENKDEEEKNKEIERCSSSLGFHNRMFSFDKMIGRKKDIFIIKEETKNIYMPKYEITRPYTYIKKFSNKTSLQEFKKYAVGKIIRNYGFFPKEYFIFDINSKKQNEINDDFLTFINEKYKLNN